MVAMGTVDEEGTVAAVEPVEPRRLLPQQFTGFLGGFRSHFRLHWYRMVGTTVAETDDPDTTLPKAVNSIPVRIAALLRGGPRGHHDGDPLGSE